MQEWASPASLKEKTHTEEWAGQCKHYELTGRASTLHVIGAHSNISAVTWHVPQVQGLPSDWLHCVACWRRREHYPTKQNTVWGCLSFKFLKQKGASLLCYRLLCRIDRHTGSEQMQSLTTLLKAKRVAGKQFKTLESHLARTRQSPPWPPTYTR